MRVVRPSALGKVTRSGSAGAVVGPASAETRRSRSAAICAVDAVTGIGLALTRRDPLGEAGSARLRLPALAALLSKERRLDLTLSYGKRRGGRVASLLLLVP